MITEFNYKVYFIKSKSNNVSLDNDKCEMPYDLTLYSILPENVFSIS